ncbi:Hypothetical protein PACV_399 [Pacmanvirus A23]|uniref:Hypothetical protein n=1 Tax=Pacmanvirus A23 TaxID=1932881 RepID=UPI000A094C13|nr:Hypothetical protein B9W72_gp395 [Pacmanvirus A23]SIP86112.1 Hypothetical protein PACV_399 [Pacmanvirus A23]
MGDRDKANACYGAMLAMMADRYGDNFAQALGEVRKIDPLGMPTENLQNDPLVRQVRSVQRARKSIKKDRQTL